MKYLVREPGKSGGTEFSTASQAVDAALDWYAQTGIACEIWVKFPHIEYRAHDKQLDAALASPTFKAMSHAFLGE